MSEEGIHDDVLNTLRVVLQEALEVPLEEITPDAHIIDDLGAESIDLLDIRFRLEKSLQIRITNEELAEAFKRADGAEAFATEFTVGAMCAYLTARLTVANE